MKNLAPIILFVYNRPAHTLQTLQALRNNPEALESDLFIFCDGPKTNAKKNTLQNIEKVRRIVQADKYCKTVTIFESEVNKGLATSIIQGVTQIMRRYKKAIILEDDIKVSPCFLKFMNKALDIYEDEEEVMHISGYMFPVKALLPNTFFFNTTSCWGWATWQRAWKHFNADTEFLFHQIKSQNLIHRFNVEGSSSHFYQLASNLNGIMDTWAVKWYASVFLRNGLCLHPQTSFTQNIGQDSTGVHSGSTNYYHIPKLASEVNIMKIPLEESTIARSAMQEFWSKESQPNLLHQLKSKFRKIFD